MARKRKQWRDICLYAPRQFVPTQVEGKIDLAALRLWKGKIHNLGSRHTLQSVHSALARLPMPIAKRAAALVVAIVVVPNSEPLGVDGFAYARSRCIFICEGMESPDGRLEEEHVTLHEVAHILDPGWEHHPLERTFKTEMKQSSVKRRREIRRAVVTDNAKEVFADIAAHLLLGNKSIRRYLPKSCALVLDALNWEG